MLPKHYSFDLAIQLEDGTTPPFGPIYSLSNLELQILREFIEENTKTGIIQPSNSPCGAPVLFVKKKDGSLCLCVDYWGLNHITQKDRYPIPLVSDLLDAPRKAWIYSKIDLRSAYHLVCIAQGNKWKTSFRTHYGSYEWLVMSFGLSNAPSAFQRFMNEIFSDLLDICIVIYLNNSLIYSDNLEEHKDHSKEVLEWLQRHKLYTSSMKCSFHQHKVEFLGFILSPGELQMDPKKVQTIMEWPTLCWVRDIQAFLGFANFYRQFIEGYSELILPLTCLTKKNEPWAWTNCCRVAFDSLKTAFSTAPLLTH